LTQQTRKNQQQRYQAKLSLMRLPDGLEKQIWQAIETIEAD
jgi:hypothetical protein